MIVYKASKRQFLFDAANGIEDIVKDQVEQRLNIRIQSGSSEYNSWKNSLGNAMYHVMNTKSIRNDATVAIEYRLPLGKMRIDFMVCGSDENQKESIVILELKQWEHVSLTDSDAMVGVTFYGRTEELHPSYKAWSYASLLRNFNEDIFLNDTRLYPCSYLHNMIDRSVVADDFYSDYLEKAPVFCKGDKDKLQDYIAGKIEFGDSSDMLRRIDTGNVRPSKELADSLSNMMRGNSEFILIDNQKIVFEKALSLGRRASTTKKSVFIVQGGPGTGKSVVAINLLASFVKLGLNANYVTKNAAPRAVFEAKLTGSMKKNIVGNLFQGSGAYVSTFADELDVLIVDEAHRLNAKSGIYKNLGENQVKELIQASKTTIFFLDEEQQVTLQDIGSKSEIEKWALEFGADIYYGALDSQFRCNGSDGYLSWLDNTLQIKETANVTLEEANYDFRVFESPEELRKTIVQRNDHSNRSRLLAGYCWDWVSKTDKSQNDIQFEDYGFSMKWNLTEDGGLFMIAPHSVDQVGCIHTSQGLELDYVGVIIGPDLYVRDGVVYTDPSKRSKMDKSLSGYKKALREKQPHIVEKVDNIIKNTYRTLMTRGMRGCYIYCTDQETREYFKNWGTCIHSLKNTKK